MLTQSTRNRIKERKIYKHSNPPQFLNRVKEQSLAAIKDLTFIAKNLEEKHLEDIFTDKTLEPLLRSILNPKSKRVLDITELISHRAFQKLMVTFPNEVANDFKFDMGKTWLFARLLADYADKPLLRQLKK